MAKRNYLVDDLSGVGKSSVYEELISRGYTAINTDRAWAYHADPDTGLPGGPIHHDNWIWDPLSMAAPAELSEPRQPVQMIRAGPHTRNQRSPRRANHRPVHEGD